MEGAIHALCRVASGQCNMTELIEWKLKPRTPNIKYLQSQPEQPLAASWSTARGMRNTRLRVTRTSDGESIDDDVADYGNAYWAGVRAYSRVSRQVKWARKLRDESHGGFPVKDAGDTERKVDLLAVYSQHYLTTRLSEPYFTRRKT